MLTLSFLHLCEEDEKKKTYYQPSNAICDENASPSLLKVAKKRRRRKIIVYCVCSLQSHSTPLHIYNYMWHFIITCNPNRVMKTKL